MENKMDKIQNEKYEHLKDAALTLYQAWACSNRYAIEMNRLFEVLRREFPEEAREAYSRGIAAKWEHKR